VAPEGAWRVDAVSFMGMTGASVCDFVTHAPRGTRGSDGCHPSLDWSHASFLAAKNRLLL